MKNMVTLVDGKKIVQILKQLDYNQVTVLSENILSQLFFQSKIISEPSIQFMNQFDEFVRKGILVRDNRKVYSTIRIVPFNNFYFIVDSPLLASTGGLEKYFSNRDNSYGYIGDDGMRLTNYIFPKISRKRHRRGLDLCAGSGLIGITLSSLFDSMHGVDIDEIAVDWMRFNAELNGIKNYTSYCGNLYEPVEELGPFDVIIANPSYSFYPPEIMEKYRIKGHETSDEFGIKLVLKIIEGFAKHLNPKGVGYICTLTPILKGEDYLLTKIVEKFSKFDYEFKIHYNFQCIHSDFKEYYHDLGIRRFCFIFIKVQKGVSFRIKKTYSRFYYLSQIPMLIKFPTNLKQHFRKILSR